MNQSQCLYRDHDFVSGQVQLRPFEVLWMSVRFGSTGNIWKQLFFALQAGMCLAILQRAKVVVVLTPTLSGDKLKATLGELFRKGYPVDAGPFGYSGFWLAAAHGKQEAMEVCFAWGANSHLPGARERLFPVEVASYMGHTNVVVWLIQKGAFPGKALHFAAKSGHLGILEKLVLMQQDGVPDDGTNVHGDPLLEFHLSSPCSCCGWTPLLLAVDFDQVAAARMLIAATSEAELKQPMAAKVCDLCGLTRGSTILHFVAAKGGYCGELVEVLLAKCPHLLHMQDEQKQKPFDVATPQIRPKLDKLYLGCAQSLRSNFLSSTDRISWPALRRELQQRFRKEIGPGDLQKVQNVVQESQQICKSALKTLQSDEFFPELKKLKEP
ncbi:Ank2 [Symbiodinium sp. CCMP2456]|nr:Ank2 [Symbiodinium sp. CCMP2456]